jgi:hypothetical protein
MQGHKAEVLAAEWRSDKDLDIQQVRCMLAAVAWVGTAAALIVVFAC